MNLLEHNIVQSAEFYLHAFEEFSDKILVHGYCLTPGDKEEWLGSWHQLTALTMLAFPEQSGLSPAAIDALKGMENKAHALIKRMATPPDVG